MDIHWISERFNFYTALSRNMSLLLYFGLAFIAGFAFVWFLFDDLGSDVVYFTSKEELEEECWDGMRKGIE